MKIKLAQSMYFRVLCYTLFLSSLFYLICISVFNGRDIQNIRLTQIYALTAFGFLYLALLTKPLHSLLPDLPFTKAFLRERKIFIVSALYFALLHANIAFFGQLGGFNGLGYLGTNYLIPITLSSIVLLILTLAVVSLFRAGTHKLNSRNRKIINTLLYIAAFLILIHALMLGTHFSKLSAFIPMTVLSAFSILVFLEAYSWDAHIKSRIKTYPQFGIISMLTAGLITVLYLLTLSSNPLLSLGIHNRHVDEIRSNGHADQKQTNNHVSYSVDFIRDAVIIPKRDTTLTFKVAFAETGEPEVLFDSNNGSQMNIVITNNNMDYFKYFRLDSNDKGTFSVTTQFPSNGTYRILAAFKPYDAGEQRFTFFTQVGPQAPNVSIMSTTFRTTPEFIASKTVGEYRVRLEKNIYNASDIQDQDLKFNISNALTGKPITTLNFLDNTRTYGDVILFDYIRNYFVIPSPITNPQVTNGQGGPLLRFKLREGNKPISKGYYKVFFEFKPENEVLTADFMIQIQ